jgi:hypothetical protein
MEKLQYLRSIRKSTWRKRSGPISFHIYDQGGIDKQDSALNHSLEEESRDCFRDFDLSHSQWWKPNYSDVNTSSDEFAIREQPCIDEDTVEKQSNSNECP